MLLRTDAALATIVKRKSPLPISDVDERTVYDKAYVRSLFDRIAHRYDLLNHLLSSGIDVYWRRRAIRLLRPYAPKVILDVATGTADFALAAACLSPERIVGIDVSETMLLLGRAKVEKKRLGELIELRLGEGESLEFADGSVDAVTVAFGVRNFTNLRVGLKEMRRVLKPGGAVLILEFSRPNNKIVRHLYGFYSHRILPIVGGVISGNREAYEYLPRTVGEFPAGAAFAAILSESGFENVHCHPLTFGIATAYIANKPCAPSSEVPCATDHG